MPAIEDIWPLFALRVRCGPLELRPLTDGDLAELVAVAQSGIHEPDRMPFYHPWTDAEPDQLARNVIQYHWGKRGDFKPEQWSLELGVQHEGTLIGTQGVSTKDFLVTRTGETGSWLGLAHQRKGIGTLMRQVICVLCFDHLGFEELTSGAFHDNPSSLAVSRKVGYVPNGDDRMKRRDAMVRHRRLLLKPEALVRPDERVDVDGAAGVRRLIGLPD